jgi:hypothetical protein
VQLRPLAWALAWARLLKVTRGRGCGRGGAVAAIGLGIGMGMIAYGA